MVRTKTSLSPTEIVPMLKTVEQMSKHSGIGINKLRELINNGEIEYIQNGNRCLLADKAILCRFSLGNSSYSRNKKNLQNYRDSPIMTITLLYRKLTVRLLVPTE